MFTNLKNNINTLFPNKGVLLLLLLSVFLVIFVIVITILSTANISDDGASIISPTPLTTQGGSSKEQKIAPTQRTIIENTNVQTIEKLPDIENKSVLSDGSIKYTFTSALISRKNEVIVQDNKVVFERILVPESTQDPGHVLISEYENVYGQPQEIFRGSRFYGHHVETYIYANKGFALIGNPITDEVFEIHTFAPTTVNDYKQKYGDDIDTEAPEGYR